MNKRTLARSSAVSERHLAALESGRGNVSVLLLRQIAIALSYRWKRCRDQDQHSTSWRSSTSCSHASQHRLGEIRARLLRETGRTVQGVKHASR